MAFTAVETYDFTLEPTLLVDSSPSKNTGACKVGSISDTGGSTGIGFEIARQDLNIRGPGEFLGAKQSGIPLLRFANLEEDVHLLERARDVAQVLISENSEVVDRHLQRWLGSREAYLGV